MLERLRRWLRPPAPASVDEATWQGIEARLPFLAYLPAQDRPRLRAMALDFLTRKQFHGAHGFVLDDRILLEIALQACLPVLNIGLDAYRGWVGIVVYPGEIIVRRHEVDEAGVVHEFDDEILGEAWEDGPVILSWHSEAVHEANVVIHEFAHKLDMANGSADGLPPLPRHISRAEWAHVFNAAYDSLCAQVDAGETPAIDPYASEHPAEFFAVAAESFFETPDALHAEFPDVYRLMQRYFDQDPLHGWHTLNRIA